MSIKKYQSKKKHHSQRSRSKSKSSKLTKKSNKMKKTKRGKKSKRSKKMKGGSECEYMKVEGVNLPDLKIDEQMALLNNDCKSTQPTLPFGNHPHISK